MIRSIAILLFAFTIHLFAQSASPRMVKCRLVGFERAPGHPSHLYARSAVEGEFIKNRVSLSIDAVPVDYPVPANGALSFLEAGDEESAVVATARIPKNAKQLLLFLIPSDDAGRPIYKVLPIEESEKNTPVGGAFICNISKHNARVTMGEHKYKLPPGKSISISQPKVRNEYNMAPLSIELFGGERWVSLKDSTTRFSKRDRYFMFTYVKQNLKRPMVKIYQQSVAINTTGAEVR
ncbi:MAG: hypothetical protein ACQCXQ_13830 [Verrucomicrobiales bacterium]|nr:hypothetical protein [Verrucomicrobiota bacterium JB025]